MYILVPVPEVPGGAQPKSSGPVAYVFSWLWPYMHSESFMQYSAALTNRNLIALFTSDAINYSFCFTIMASDYCRFHVLIVSFIVVVSRLRGQILHQGSLHLWERPWGPLKNQLWSSVDVLGHSPYVWEH